MAGPLVLRVLESRYTLVLKCFGSVHGGLLLQEATARDSPAHQLPGIQDALLQTAATQQSKSRCS
jgi:hypothetical protein